MFGCAGTSLHGFPLVVVRGGSSLVLVRSLLIAVASLFVLTGDRVQASVVALGER